MSMLHLIVLLIVGAIVLFVVSKIPLPGLVKKVLSVAIYVALAIYVLQFLNVLHNVLPVPASWVNESAQATTEQAPTPPAPAVNPHHAIKPTHPAPGIQPSPAGAPAPTEAPTAAPAPTTAPVPAEANKPAAEAQPAPNPSAPQ